MRPEPTRAANVSAETHAMTDAVIAWQQKRMPGARVLRELVLGERRIDLLFVYERDLVGFEIKGPRDRLDRLRDQVREYQRYVPEVWVALDAKFKDADEHRWWCMNRVVVERDGTVANWRSTTHGKPHRDELVCSRMLEILWASEAVRIAQRTDVIPGPAHKQLREAHVKKLLARLLTGNEIIAEVCRELRARPWTGMGSGEPLRAGTPA